MKKIRLNSKFQLNKSVYLSVILAVAAVSSCTVSHTYVKDTYETEEKKTVKRIGLAVTPNEHETSVNRLYNEIRFDHLSSKKEYIIPKFLYNVNLNDLADACKKNPDLNGIIFTEFRELQPNEKKTRVRINSVSSLWSCDKKDKVWEAAGSGTWSSRDSGYTQVISSYTNRIGESAVIYAVPFFKYIKKMYKSLPDPLLTDDDIMEKVMNDAEGPKR